MILGVDVSSWQGRMDWQVCAAAGAKFAYIRAGSCSYPSGVCFSDARLAENAGEAPKWLKVGYYWYLRPEYDPQHQAEYFWQLVKDQPGDLPPVVDVECRGRLTPVEAAASLRTFLERIKLLSGKRALIYTRALWWNENIAADPSWQEHDLWIARYCPSLNHPWGDGDCQPRDWNEWRFWQFSANGNRRGAEFGAQSSSIDLDYFNGEAEDLAAYCTGIKPANIVQVRAGQIGGLRSQPAGKLIGAIWPERQLVCEACSLDGKWLKIEAWIKADQLKEVA
jgi:lysozyme